MSDLTPSYEPEAGQVILEGLPAGAGGEARLVPVTGLDLAFDRADGHLSRGIVDADGADGPGELVAAMLVRLFGREAPDVVRDAAVRPGESRVLSPEPGLCAALSSLAGRRVHAIAAIGNPQRFFAQLAAAGLTVITHAFPDHHRYGAAELEFGDDLPLLMTEKDAVKCRPFAAVNRWYLPVAASFAGTDGSALLTRLQRCLAP